jgi:hypothetical protein
VNLTKCLESDERLNLPQQSFEVGETREFGFRAQVPVINGDSQTNFALAFKRQP